MDEAFSPKLQIVFLAKFVNLLLAKTRQLPIKEKHLTFAWPENTSLTLIRVINWQLFCIIKTVFADQNKTVVFNETGYCLQQFWNKFSVIFLENLRISSPDNKFHDSSLIFIFFLNFFLTTDSPVKYFLILRYLLGKICSICWDIIFSWSICFTV